MTKDTFMNHHFGTTHKIELLHLEKIVNIVLINLAPEVKVRLDTASDSQRTVFASLHLKFPSVEFVGGHTILT